MARIIQSKLFGEQRVKKSGLSGWIGFFSTSRGEYFFRFKLDSSNEMQRSVKNYGSAEELRQAANRFLNGDETA